MFIAASKSWQKEEKDKKRYFVGYYIRYVGSYFKVVDEKTLMLVLLFFLLWALFVGTSNSTNSFD